MNIGLCRKSATGVMCPSYMATADEEHSTRGRANALVKALSMPDPRAALGDQRLHEILDLCLECKACKSECPLGVDLAAMKSEALSAYHELHGVPPRARLFGAIRLLNRAGSATFPLSNKLAASQVLRRAGERWLGVTASRPLPRYHRDDLRAWFKRRPAGSPGPTAPGGLAGSPDVASVPGELIFLADCFTTFTEPSVGIAAIELLELAGWQVRLEQAGCCGRASLSKGLVDRARRMAAEMTERLGDAASAGIPVVGVEPSCLLMLKDDYPALLGDDARAAALATAVRLPEELLLEAIAAGRLALAPDSAVGGKRIMLHGHCHQKAVVGMTPTTELLRSIPGVEVAEIDAGCCGMAGSFGFEAEHYQLSMRIGQLRLFPAILAEPPECLTAATGVSCRQQIAHGTGRRARHPLEILWQSVIGPGKLE
jgi:Fe-S oxidoreductase